MARHRSPRGRRAHPTLPFPLVGTSGGDSARRASHASPVRTPLPAPVLRGVTFATVAAVAVTGGAVAVAGTGVQVSPADGVGELRLATESGAAAPVPSPVAAIVPAPVVPVSDTLATDVLDTGLLSDAVKRAQDEAARLAEDARAKETEAQAAADRAEQAEEDRRTAEQGRRVGRIGEPDPKPATTDCGLNTGQLGAVKPGVRTTALFLGCAFDKPTVLGVAGRAGASDHPSGRALDFMVDRATGDRLAACAIEHRDELGISYVIWRQRIDTGSGFRPMEDRGSPTANHFDHVHVSFNSGAAAKPPTSC